MSYKPFEVDKNLPWEEQKRLYKSAANEFKTINPDSDLKAFYTKHGQLIDPDGNGLQLKNKANTGKPPDFQPKPKLTHQASAKKRQQNLTYFSEESRALRQIQREIHKQIKDEASLFGLGDVFEEHQTAAQLFNTLDDLGYGSDDVQNVLLRPTKNKAIKDQFEELSKFFKSGDKIPWYTAVNQLDETVVINAREYDPRFSDLLNEGITIDSDEVGIISRFMKNGDTKGITPGIAKKIQYLFSEGVENADTMDIQSARNLWNQNFFSVNGNGNGNGIETRVNGKVNGRGNGKGNGLVSKVFNKKNAALLTGAATASLTFLPSKTIAAEVKDHWDEGEYGQAMADYAVGIFSQETASKAMLGAFKSSKWLLGKSANLIRSWGVKNSTIKTAFSIASKKAAKFVGSKAIAAYAGPAAGAAIVGLILWDVYNLVDVLADDKLPSSFEDFKNLIQGDGSEDGNADTTHFMLDTNRDKEYFF